MPQGTGTQKFFPGDTLTLDDVLDWHGVIILPPPNLPLEGGGASYIRAPLPFREGAGG